MLTTAWQLPDDCLMTAWQLLDNCLTTAWRLFNECLMTARRLPDDCLTTAWWLPDDCLTTAWWLIDDCQLITSRLPDDCLTYKTATKWWQQNCRLMRLQVAACKLKNINIGNTRNMSKETFSSTHQNFGPLNSDFPLFFLHIFVNSKSNSWTFTATSTWNVTCH